MIGAVSGRIAAGPASGDPDPPRLPVGGVAPFSTVDFPGKLAAVFFLQGCPWRCGYCHNPHLQPSCAGGEREFDALLGWLEERRGLLDAVVFSGGEPTAHASLAGAIREVAARGFAVGLHTGGAYPRRIAAALEHADWVGFDLKAPRRDYPRITGVEASGDRAFESLGLVLAADVPHEIRTTVHPALSPDESMLRLADELASLGVRRWALQPFRPAGCIDTTLVAAAPRSAGIDAGLLARLRERVPAVEIRG